MSLSHEEAIAGLKLFNCNTKIVQTGHPRYAIGFIEHGGVSIGKIIYVDGKYCHIKWYSQQRKYWLIYLGWTIWLNTGSILTHQHLDDLVILAEQAVEDRYNEHQQWRLDNPRPLTRPNGTKISKRKPLQRRSLWNAVSTIAYDKYEVFSCVT